MKKLTQHAVVTLLLFLTHISHARGEAPVVVELFTSQGCHSCPRADKFLGELSTSPNIIAIACHVTYWNYLGWRDTLSTPFCDRRQESYAHTFNLRSAYTPQMIINGRYQAVGSQRSTIHRMLDIANTQNTLIPLGLQLSGKTLIVDLSALNNKQKADIYLLGIGNKHDIDIRRGENGGRTLTYHKPLIQHKRLGRWPNIGATPSHETDTHSQVDQWVVLAQDRKRGFLVGAGSF